jgi:hypothetical protein
MLLFAQIGSGTALMITIVLSPEPSVQLQGSFGFIQSVCRLFFSDFMLFLIVLRSKHRSGRQIGALKILVRTGRTVFLSSVLFNHSLKMEPQL